MPFYIDPLFLNTIMYVALKNTIIFIIGTTICVVKVTGYSLITFVGAKVQCITPALLHL